MSGRVSFSFDEAYRNVIDSCYPAMAAHGYPGTVNMVSDKIGVTNYLTSANLQTLSAAGWEIASHSKTHPDLTTKTFAEIETEMSASQTALRAIDASWAKGFTYPFGTYDSNVLELATKYYDYATAANHSYVLFPYRQARNYTTGVIESGYTIRRGTSVDLAAAKVVVDLAVERNWWVIIFFHDMGLYGGSETFTVADFLNLVNYVATTGAEVGTVYHLLHSEPRHLITGNNLVTNPAWSDWTRWYKTTTSTYSAAGGVLTMTRGTGAPEIDQFGILVKSGETLNYSVELRRTSATSGNVYMTLRSEGINFTTNFLIVNTTLTDWTTKSGTVVVPSGVYSMYVRFALDNTANLVGEARNLSITPATTSRTAATGRVAVSR